MHKRLIEEGFNRRYVLLPLMLSIALVLLGYSITESRRAQAKALTEVLRQRQEVIRLLTETSYKVIEAESAQRGFLLTGEEKYLAPLETGLAATKQRLTELGSRYKSLDPTQLPMLEKIGDDLGTKTAEMRLSVDLLKNGKPRDALALVKSDLGLYQMVAIGEALEAMRANERANVSRDLDDWKNTIRINTWINVGNMAFAICILLILGLLVTRDIRRRNIFATDLAVLIETRTAELRDLSRHMSRVAESEKHALARELHDELGGLLVAMRMDIAQIRKQLGTNTDPALQVRWDRIEQALTQGMELKRRVIEDLRPTLLDNMGLFTALKWLASERSELAQLTLQVDGLDDDIDIPQDTAIAVFRTVQEAIANVVKHAGASRLQLTANVGARLAIEISDDGRGVPPQADRRTGSHGLKQMRFRMEAIGGDLQINARLPKGTSILLSVPLDQPAA